LLVACFGIAVNICACSCLFAALLSNPSHHINHHPITLILSLSLSQKKTKRQRQNFFKHQFFFLQSRKESN
jgi:hypothetical protein